MQVIDLLVKLQGMNPNDIVVISSDDEGNSYREVKNVYGGNVVFTPDKEVRFTSLTLKQIRAGFGVEDMYDGNDAKFCVVVS